MTGAVFVNKPTYFLPAVPKDSAILTQVGF